MVVASNAPSQPLTVNYVTAGNAHLGSDYTLSGTVGQVVIPAGQTSATITLTALHDNTIKEKAESAKFILNPNAGYNLPKKAGRAVTVKIINVK
jgi:hypothetical protein